MRFSNVAYTLSQLLIILAVAMLPSLGYALIDGDGLWVLFLALPLGMAFFSGSLRMLNLKPKELTVQEGFVTVTLAWILMSAVGALPFTLSGYVPSYTDAYFETMSGFTTTGASILRDIEALPRSLLLWRSMTQWLGGMGVIALTVAIFPFFGLGGFQLFKAESPGPMKDKVTPRVSETAKIFWLIYIALSVAETVLLLLGGLSFFEAVCTTFSSMATGGFSPRNASIAAYASPYVHYVVILFMFIAGASFSLHFSVLRGGPKVYARDPEFRLYALIIGGATLAIMASRLLAKGPLSEATFRGSLFQTVSIITTTGFITENYDTTWPLFARIVLLLLMFVGGCSSSTGGGMKNVRILVMLKNIGAELRRMLHPRSLAPVKLAGKAMPEEINANIMAFISLYMLFFIAGVLFMLASGLTLDVSIGAVAANLGNVGPGLGTVGAIGNYAHLPAAAKWVLSFEMLAGRLEIFPILMVFNRRFWR